MTRASARHAAALNAAMAELRALRETTAELLAAHKYERRIRRGGRIVRHAHALARVAAAERAARAILRDH